MVSATLYIQTHEPTTAWIINYDDQQLFYENVKYGERYGRLGIENVFINILKQGRSYYLPY
jgi:hypothetical protein